jgi:hypothetical protein
LGTSALFSNTEAEGNTAVGFNALTRNTTGYQNTATGFEALASSNGIANTAVGYQALLDNTSNGNTAIGAFALQNATSGGNTAIGGDALRNLAGGIGGNTALGAGAGFGVGTASHVIVIGAGVAGQNVNESCYIGNIWTKPGGSQPVYVNSEGKLGELVSSRRFKDDIKPMEQASEIIHCLKPVSFRYKPEIEPTRPLGFGLIAEDVEKISPDLVTRGSDGKVQSVRYDAVNAMLLNEFLKEHRKGEEQDRKLESQDRRIEQQEATIVQLKKEMEALVARVKEQDSRIQQVSDQVDTSKAAGQFAINNP